GQSDEGRVIPLSQYWDMLENSIAGLAGVEDLTADEQMFRRRAIAGQWELIDGVDVGEEVVLIDTDYLVERLDNEAVTIDELRRHFRRHLQVRSEWPQRLPVAGATEELAKILEGSAYQWEDVAESNVLTDIVEWFTRNFYRLLTRPFSSGGWTAVVTIVVWVFLMLLVGIVFWQLRANLVQEANFDPSLADEAVLLTAETALTKAKDLSGEGDYRTAVRYLYLSTLLRLEEKGKLAYDRSRTNREYVRSMARQPEIAAILQGVIEVFDRVWYGFEPLSVEEYMHYEQQVEQLRQMR
ncbi:MAG TPA: DUF4129 domain-containing protein, partial [Anaerolineae bacterium]|nr:DUF4129 domain-containing protein [Anaerolineae bacterium]